MDLTIAQKIAAFTAKPPFNNFPKSSLNPAIDLVNPGVGGSINLYTNYVPIYSHKHYTEVKKIEVKENDQSGGGQQNDNDDVLNKETSEKLDPQIFRSFQRPKFAETDKITFSNKRKQETPEKEKDKKVKHSNEKKIIHKFQFF